MFVLFYTNILLFRHVDDDNDDDEMMMLMEIYVNTNTYMYVHRLIIIIIHMPCGWDSFACCLSLPLHYNIFVYLSVQYMCGKQTFTITSIT